MWGIVPAAGRGSRIQPLAFSKELLPVGSRTEGAAERPCAVSEYLLERMLLGGVDKICFVISPGKSDIMEYFGASYAGVSIVYVIQPQPSGLCDAVFRAKTIAGDQESVVVGLPDTIWFPDTGLAGLPDDMFSFLLFPVERPEFFDAVVLNGNGQVIEIQVKQRNAESNWVWGAFKLPSDVFEDLHRLWLDRDRQDEYFGTLVNAYLAEGGAAAGFTTGESYVDVGTPHGYRAAMSLLAERPHSRKLSMALAEVAASDRCPEPPAFKHRRDEENTATTDKRTLSIERIRRRVEALGPWFQNLDLKGVQTAPTHFLGNYPAEKWRSFADAIPADLSGKTVLDIGCNAGFYSMEMKRRGAARVLGVDTDEDYLNQARFAAEVSGLDIEFRRLSVYEAASIGERFDIVLFMGVFYHLRHPLLALDLIHEYLTRDLLVFQSMQRGSSEVQPVHDDYAFWEMNHFRRPGSPKLHFVEKRYAGDPTNWWIPNRACAEAMLRSAGFGITAHPEDEVYICRHIETNPEAWLS
jgi:tRNA (mo5U34)-methyltransferase